MGEKFRWAYVGSGSIARQTAHQIVKGNHIISSVFSRNIEKAKDFAGSYNAKAYDNFDAMLQAGGFDAVYIGTPHTSHVDYAIRSMDAGYPVFCEKPAGVSLKEVNALFECAKKNDIYCAEAFKISGTTIKSEWIIQSDTDYYYAEYPDNSDYEIACEECLADFMVKYNYKTEGLNLINFFDVCNIYK